MQKMTSFVVGTKYTNITVYLKNMLFNGMPRTVYKVKLGDTVFPGFFDNISYHNTPITIFTITGNIFAGSETKLSFEIEKYPNGVVRGNIRVIDNKENVAKEKQNRRANIDISYTITERADYRDMGGDIEIDSFEKYESFTDIDSAYKRFEELLGTKNVSAIRCFCFEGWCENGENKTN